MNPQKIAVLGPGSWGTALSQVLNDNGHEVRIWGNNVDQIAEINEKHTNERYFKGITLNQKISAYTDLEFALSDVDAILFVVPTKVTRLVAQQVAKVLKHKVTVMHASKGLEQGTHERISSILEEEIPEEYRSEIVVVSGPSHAEETIRRDITLISAASNDLETAKYAQEIFSNDYFRLYTNTDVIGVETAGALKNIIAVGAGALHGLGFGDNAKAAIITRGLAEITRLGVAMGAQPLTYSGLSGVGDLIVTGTRFTHAIGEQVMLSVEVRNLRISKQIWEWLSKVFQQPKPLTNSHKVCISICPSLRQSTRCFMKIWMPVKAS